MDIEKSPYKNRQIVILGPQNLQNELFAYVLQREIGARCRIEEDIEDLAGKLDAEAEQRLLLVDCSGRNIKKTLEGLKALDTDTKWTLFNISVDNMDDRARKIIDMLLESEQAVEIKREVT